MNGCEESQSQTSSSTYSDTPVYYIGDTAYGGVTATSTSSAGTPTYTAFTGSSAPLGLITFPGAPLTAYDQLFSQPTQQDDFLDGNEFALDWVSPSLNGAPVQSYSTPFENLVQVYDPNQVGGQVAITAELRMRAAPTRSYTNCQRAMGAGCADATISRPRNRNLTSKTAHICSRTKIDGPIYLVPNSALGPL